MADEKKSEDTLGDDAKVLAASVVEPAMAALNGLASADPGVSRPPTTVNINMVFTQVAQKESNPEKWAEQMKTVLEIARKYEEQEISLFERRSAAVIKAKTDDPDYVDRRANSRSRRVMRYAVASVAVLGVVAFIVLAYNGATWPVLGALIALATASVALSAGLGAGGDAPTPEEIKSLLVETTRSPRARDVDAVPGRDHTAKRKGKRGK